MNKFEFVSELLVEGSSESRTLLDVGCRRCELKAYLPDQIAYTGVDLYQNEAGSVDFVLDVEKGLPIPDDSYDYVVALDVLEHLNDLEGALRELVRVARRRVIVMLPNIANVFFRWKFLLRGQINGKYILQYGGSQDRHRWVTVLPEMDEYFRRFAQENRLGLEVNHFNDSSKKQLLQRVGRSLRIPPVWWVWAAAYDLNKGDAGLPDVSTMADADREPS